MAASGNIDCRCMKSLSTIVYGCLSFLARMLPTGVAYLIGETLSIVTFPLLRSRKRNLESNLKVVLAHEGTPHARSQTTRLALAVAVNFGRAVVDAFMVPYLDSKAIRIEVKGKEHLESALRAGRGVILVTAHLGTWELGGAVLAAMGYRFTTVAGTQFAPWLSPHIKTLKQAIGIEVVAHTSALRIMRVLKTGGLVVLHIDGDRYLGGLKVSFFGRPATVPRGPAALALRVGAKLLCGFAVRKSRCEIAIEISREIPVIGNETEVTQRIIDVVETNIRKHKNQWCMFRAIWEDQQ